MKSSIEAHALIRKNFEEQRNALDEFKAWETKIKTDDAKIKSRKLSNPLSLPSLIARGSFEEGECKSNDIEDGVLNMQVPPHLHKSASVVIGGSNNTKVPNNPVPTAPIDKQESKPSSKEELSKVERVRGNKLFGTGDYEGAKKCYSQSIHFDPSSALAYSNRAMANLKLKDWHSAESDASTAINLDSLHLKSYQRRSAARLALGKVRAALNDLHKAKSVLHILRQQSNSVIKGEEKAVLPQDINTTQVEIELLKVMKNAPRRKVPIEVKKGCSPAKCSSALLKNIENKDEVPKPIVKCSAVKNWLEFEQIWKASLKSSQQKIDFLNSIKPKKFIQLYKNGMEDSGLLVDLIVHCSKIKKGFTLVKDMSLIPSIDMLPMMMSTREKEMFLSHINDVLKDCTNKDDVNSIKHNFGL